MFIKKAMLIKLLFIRNTVKDFIENSLFHNHNTMDESLIFVAQITIGGNIQQIMELPGLAMMTADEAQQKFFDHWDYIDAVTKRRFPKDENLLLEASQYIHRTLSDKDWEKLRAFEGKNFTAFITTVISHLLSDFWREKFGRERPNTWLKQQNDPIYEIAFQLLVRDKYSKQEVISILTTSEATREQWKIQEIIEAILANCPIKPEYQKISLGENDGEEKNYAAPSLEEQIEVWHEQNLLEILIRLLNGETENISQVNKLLTLLSENTNLTEEESLLLRLRYSEGLKLREISKRLGYRTESQVDKRIKKTLIRLRNSFNKLGLLDEFKP
ncbi:hypothetical protein [Candidatus Parabeggiatoa sp. HSG14]|uniref:hypothetical protein n=1 Tax=Candidatus Parabeggiatoa sp. HSG14 TaxID=3055593 RepID=UPI0025A7680B|nr:hypothetical protein [Thiotrichales bacterium HSG14]